MWLGVRLFPGSAFGQFPGLFLIEHYVWLVVSEVHYLLVDGCLDFARVHAAYGQVYLVADVLLQLQPHVCTHFFLMEMARLHQGLLMSRQGHPHPLENLIATTAILQWFLLFARLIHCLAMVCLDRSVRRSLRVVNEGEIVRGLRYAVQMLFDVHLTG